MPLNITRKKHSVKTRYTLSVASLAASFFIAHQADAANTWADSRGDAMGGTGVASADYGNAVLINPALLAKSHSDDDITMILPSANVEVSDKDSLQNKIDNIHDTVDTFRSQMSNTTLLNLAQQLPKIQSTAGSVADDLSNLQGKTARAKAAAGLAISIPNDTLSMAFVTKAWARARVSSYIDPDDITALRAIQNSRVAAINAALNASSFRSSLHSTGFGRAAIVQDYGIAMAHSFSISGVPVSVGVTPKLQQTWLYNYSMPVYNYQSSDFRDGQYRNSNTGFNMDIGLAADLSDHWTVGLTGQNLLSRNINTKTINGYTDTFQITPLVTAGVAWKNDLVTLTADADLTQTKGFRSEENAQYVGVGAEIRPLSWLAVRTGYRADLRGNDNNAVTAGLGFTPIKNVSVDLNGLVGQQQTWGAGVQLTFRF